MLWRELAACKGLPSEWWWSGVGTKRAQKDHAIDICNNCPVRRACLKEALAMNDEGVIRGATQL